MVSERRREKIRCRMYTRAGKQMHIENGLETATKANIDMGGGPFYKRIWKQGSLKRRLRNFPSSYALCRRIEVDMLQ